MPECAVCLDECIAIVSEPLAEATSEPVHALAGHAAG